MVMLLILVPCPFNCVFSCCCVQITAATLTVIDPHCCSTDFDNVDVTMIHDINLHAKCCLSVVMLHTTDKKLSTIPIKLCNDRAIEVEQILRNLRERDQTLLGNNNMQRGTTGGGGGGH